MKRPRRRYEEGSASAAFEAGVAQRAAAASLDEASSGSSAVRARRRDRTEPECEHSHSWREPAKQSRFRKPPPRIPVRCPAAIRSERDREQRNGQPMLRDPTASPRAWLRSGSPAPLGTPCTDRAGDRRAPRGVTDAQTATTPRSCSDRPRNVGPPMSHRPAPAGPPITRSVAVSWPRKTPSERDPRRGTPSDPRTRAAPIARTTKGRVINAHARDPDAPPFKRNAATPSVIIATFAIVVAAKASTMRRTPVPT
jgi:hypothetical protein